MHARLWEQTRTLHGDLEKRFDELRIEVPSGYLHFLSAHSIALSCAADWLSSLNSPHERTFRQLVSKIDTDLRALGARSPRATLDLMQPESDLGILYVVGGSSLGARVLLKRIAASATGETAPPAGYLKSENLRHLWGALRPSLAIASARGATADRAVSSAEQTFECFRMALGLIKQERVDG